MQLFFPLSRAQHPLTNRKLKIENTLMTTVSLGFLLSAVTAFAEEQKTLPAVTVHGFSSDLGDQLVREQARDIRDVLDRDASVDIGGGTRQGQRLYLRGIEGSNINITVDGAHQGQNLHNHRGGLGNIDPDIMKIVDINPGPATADSGPGAIGGRIRMETVDAQDLLTSDRDFGARLRTGYASASKSKRGSASVYGLLGPGIGLLGHFSIDDYDNMRIGNGDRIPYSGGKDESYLFKLSLLEMGAHQLRLGTERHKATGLNYQQRGDYPWEFQPDFASRPPRDQTLIRKQHTLNYDFNPDSQWIDSAITLYKAENSWDNNFNNVFESEGWGTDVRNRFHYGTDQVKGILTVGFDYSEDKGTNAVSNRPTDIKNKYENLGFYAQNRLSAERGDIWFGIRYDDFDSRFSNGTTHASNHETSLNIGGELNLIHGFSLFAGYGEAARGGSAIPIHFAGNIVSGATLNGVTDGTLDAEKSRQSEAGLRWRDNTGGIQKRFEILAFQNRISDTILFAQPGSGGLGNRPVTDIYNADGTAVFKGYEIRAGYTSGRFQADISFMHLDTSGLPDQPQFLVRFGAPQGDRLAFNLNYALADGLDLGYGLTAVSRLKDVPDNQTVFIEKAGYAVHDVFLNWQPKGLRNLSIDFAVHNLLDKRYSRHATLSQDGISTFETGRDVHIGLRYSF